MNKQKRLVMRAVILAVIVAALGYTIYQMFTDKSVVEAGETAPNFVLETLSGEQVSLEDYRGKGVILNFWATWCDPCEEEMPYLQAAYEEYKDQGIEIVAVDIRESKLAVQTFVKRHGLTFPILLDRKGEVTTNYNIGPIPTTFVINPEGVVVEKVIGPMPNQAYVEKMMEMVVPEK